MLATQAAVAIQNARLHEQVQRHAQTLEERVQQRTAELEAKARELESFSYSVSHDLKAPLRGIDGYSRLLQESYFDQLDEEGRLFLELIRAGVDQMRQLIDDLLAYSRLERRSLTTSQIQLAPLVEAIVAERAAEIDQRRVQLTIQLNCESVAADTEGLRQALRNLLDNALKFTRDTAEPVIEIGGNENQDACVLWVRDNGIGFDMRYHDRIFEIFQRLQRSEDYPGTGIGLAIVRKAMQRMGGHVWAESVSGVGATFFLEFPTRHGTQGEWQLEDGGWRGDNDGI
jgi:light-regulated signal transduction histidine kinase (bacteriophytochrome)